ncbi:MAG: nitrilase family protein [Bacteroidales bacterium]|nr:nitrilase family protein [Bacteroidales bacterium]
MNELHITFYQQDIIWGDAEANRQKVKKMLANTVVSASGADIFVVPETFTTGFGDHMAALAEEQEGPTLQWARRMAAQYDMLFVGTWIVKEDGKVYNRLHWVYPDGTFGTYDKGHTFRVSGEADVITRGTEKAVFEYKGWRIKPAVCYDLRFPKWLRNSELRSPNSELDYDLLLICANWPGSRHEAWTTLLKARAIENLCYVLGCNRSGIDGVGGKYTGNSALVDYKGFSVAEAEHGANQTVTATLDKERLNTFRQHWPFYLDFD